MIYVTGDIHGNTRRFFTKYFPKQKEMTKDDYIVICGDFGLVWDWEGESVEEQFLLDELDKRNFTTLFVDGNHENFNRLNAYPVTEWHGGKVHMIRPTVIHLMRGQVFDICGKKCFTFGGARSHDIDGLATDGELEADYTAGILQPDDPKLEEKKKLAEIYATPCRVENRTWWRAEQPDKKEMEEGRKNLAAVGNKVDYIFTHEAPALLQKDLAGKDSPYLFTQYLQEIRDTVDYGHWYFGHYHRDFDLTEKDTLIYFSIIEA
ncbi:MAG: metallophosphoesterase [Candidatus Weimeria sp.]